MNACDGVTSIVQNYEALSSLMGLMSEAAAQGQWDRLTALETQCREQVALMKQVDTQQVSLSEDGRARKKALILKMLADDATIRRHAQPWMEKLEWAMRVTSKEQQIRRAYAGR